MADNNTATLSLFPLDKYDQRVSTWFPPSSLDYDKALLTPAFQKQHLNIFYQHYFGDFSPWSANYVTQILHQPTPNNLQTIEQNIIVGASNTSQPAEQINYKENFQPYTNEDINAITENIDVKQLGHLTYHPEQRGILIDNAEARVLPTNHVFFYNHTLAGQGYPFDNIQISAVWAGTPVYVISQSKNHAWSLVYTPDIIGWVPSNTIAFTDHKFISFWEKAAKNKLAAITHTETSIINKKGNALFTAYVGAVFPAKNNTEVWVPVKTQTQMAAIETIKIASENIAIMPESLTPHHFANIISSLVGRPYGWGNMYFYNDCSGELKNLFTVFGIWLPRHSEDQTQAGKMIDMSSATPEQRLAYLMQNGSALSTIVYTGGHVFIYIGNYPNPNTADHALMAMTYQNIWGFAPNPSTRRAVVGQAAFLPLLLQYPEDPTLTSLANKHYFQISYLNQSPEDSTQLTSVNLNRLMGYNEKTHEQKRDESFARL